MEKTAAFLIKQQDSMQFKIIRRGDPQPEPNNLSISRNLWLDFAGTGYTVQDRINGSITHGWRLDSLAETQLGQVQINGQAQLITRSTNNDSEGVELRKGRLALVADSRIDNTIKQISATGAGKKHLIMQKLSYTFPPAGIFSRLVVLIMCLIAGLLAGRY
jgi:hypothetical protein